MKKFMIRVPRWPGSSELCWRTVEAENCDEAVRIGEKEYCRVVDIFSLSECEVEKDD